MEGNSEMAKFCGKIGFGGTFEKKPGVCEIGITEHEYSGDVLRDITRMENSGQVIDDINISNSISIIADPYAFQNFHSIKYVTWMGAKWKVRSVDVQYPRLILSIGGVWNDEGGAET